MTTLTTTNDMIKNPSHKHEEIMRWLLENPEKKLKDLALHMNVTQTWLSIIIHSELFQEKFEEMRKEYLGAVLPDIGEKLNAIANVALDKLAEELEYNDDPKFLLNVADKTLGRLGYGAKINNVDNNKFVQNNVIVSAASFEAMQQAENLRNQIQNKLIEGEYTHEKTEGLEGRGEHKVGNYIRSGATVQKASSIEGEIQEGD